MSVQRPVAAVPTAATASGNTPTGGSSGPSTSRGTAPASVSSSALTAKDDPLAHVVYDALVQLRGWLARNGPDRGKSGASILPVPVVNQLAR